MPSTTPAPRAATWQSLWREASACAAVLAAFGMTRPVRDELSVQLTSEAGVDLLQTLLVVTFGVMLVMSAAVGWLRRLLTGAATTRFVTASVAAGIAASFAGLLGTDVPWAQPAAYVFLSAANLLVVSCVWSSLAERFDAAEAKAAFGRVALIGGLGAIGGSATAALAAAAGHRLAPLLLASFLLTLACVLIPSPRHSGTQRQRLAGLGGLADGVMACARSPLIAGLAAFVFLTSLTATLAYLEQARMLSGAASLTRDDRAALLASIDLAAAVLAIPLQYALTHRLLHKLGLTGTLAVLPAVATVGFAVLWLHPTLGVLIAYQVVRRATQFAFARPAREILLVPCTPQERYAAKSLIDTVIYRAGDAGAAGVDRLLLGLTASLGSVGLPAVPIAATWTLLAVYLGRRFNRGVAASAGTPHIEQAAPADTAETPAAAPRARVTPP